MKVTETTHGDPDVDFIRLSAKATLWPLKNTVIMNVFEDSPGKPGPSEHTPILTDTHIMPWHMT